MPAEGLQITPPSTSYASDGSGISYNNITVTNGWESVVNGVTVNNTWSDNFIDSDEMISWVDNGNDGSTTGWYQNAQNGNRDFTTGTNLLNESSNIVNYPEKEYSWLGYNVTESKQRYSGSVCKALEHQRLKNWY